MTVYGQMKTVIDICQSDIALFAHLRHVPSRHVLHQSGIHSRSYLQKPNFTTRSPSIPEISKIHARNHSPSSSSPRCSHCRTPSKLDSSAYSRCTLWWYPGRSASRQRSLGPVALVECLGFRYRSQGLLGCQCRCGDWYRSSADICLICAYLRCCESCRWFRCLLQFFFCRCCVQPVDSESMPVLPHWRSPFS